MSRNRFSAIATAAMIVFALTGLLWTGTALALDPAQAQFRDASGDKVRSDGEGVYIDISLGGDCVRSWVSNTGNAFMNNSVFGATRVREALG